MPSQLDVQDCPIELLHIWEWWVKLSERRQSGMDLCTITYSEIESCVRLYKMNVIPFEIDCVIQIESTFMRIRREQIARRTPSPSSTSN